MSIPVMMTIAGSDCSAGAGLQADLKAAHAMGAFALTAVTCVVSEAPGTVRGIQEVDPALVADQVRINLEHFPVRAVKTGMLYSPAMKSFCCRVRHCLRPIWMRLPYCSALPLIREGMNCRKPPRASLSGTDAPFF